MKTIKFFILITAVAFAALAHAVEKPKLEITPVTSEKAVVAISNENPAKFEVEVKGDAGEILYQAAEEENATHSKKLYDFSLLEDGSYEIAFKVNDTYLKKNIEITGNNIEVGESAISYDPYFLLQGDLLKLSFLNFGTKNVSITFYENGVEFFDKRLGKDFSLNKAFDLSLLASGEYNVILSDQDKYYSYSFMK